MTPTKPWREVAVPHPDVLQGTFQQSEFAADISAVRDGKASHEYQNAAAFFQRTFITEGMRLLLTQVAQRLNGKGGEPVIQLQTAFGGGKTHTMLAVYHLATRRGPLKELAGIPALLDQAGLMDVPTARVAVLDGSARGPAEPYTCGQTRIHALWGELAFQLGGDDGYALVRDSDLSGTSPGKAALRALLERFAPCVVLVDELVAYIRQFSDATPLAGGTYDSNLSFAQALTEAAKLVPTAIVLASLPESEVEAGSSRGVAALKALEKTFGRVQALWKPVAAEEAFEIVRRRLFEPIRDMETRNAVCRAFSNAYAAEAKLPSETHEARYHDRLVRAYPIHPEVFDRLYEDWTTLESFQRTRGVLKLMARVIHRLWQGQNQDLMILPGSIPLSDSGTRDELMYHLPPGWDAVIERDIDGYDAETAALERREPRFGAVNAAHRVARTVFLGSAPSSGSTHKGIRGVERARVLLGCLQPGQSASTFSDALNRLCDRLHYLNSSGDKEHDATRFWFDTRANLRREMEDRKNRFDDRVEVRAAIAEALKKLVAGASLFEAVHVFTPSGDIPDDSALRLVVLPVEKAFSKQEARTAEAEVLEIVRTNGSKPRYRGNRLVFLAPDQGALARLRDCVRTALAWNSIVADIGAGRLNIDRLQEQRAKEELHKAGQAVPGAARECFRWLLCPVMASPTDREGSVEAYALPTSSGTFADAVERVCGENELVISVWSPIHLRSKLQELYWKEATVAVRAASVWEDMQRYLYMPRLKRRAVFEQAIATGAGSRDFFGTAYGQSGDQLEGFKLGDANVQFDDTLLLIEPAAAVAYESAQQRPASVPPSAGGARGQGGQSGDSTATAGGGSKTSGTGGVAPRPEPGGAQPSPAASRPKAFFGSVDVNATTAKMKLVSIAEEIIAVLAGDPNASVKVTVEISAEFPAGASEQTRRAVWENATALGFKSKSWE
ncbi:ATP-binding protein [Sorangium sp. So ce381]|uniref:ATP-binding protein n=1 Tax=Sorangium sp. So ce381 TaxID=3133307 RepID=UPI003F5BE82E